MGIYDYSVEKRNREMLSLKEYEGKVLLITRENCSVSVLCLYRKCWRI